MFFLMIAILETFATILFGIVAAAFDTIYIGGFAFSLYVISCIFWFSLYILWERAKKAKEKIDALTKSLNECRKKLNLPEFKEEEPEVVPTYNPYFNPYAEENGIDIDDNASNETD